jgi:DNA-binding MarR family transcriptional regulator
MSRVYLFNLRILEQLKNSWYVPGVGTAAAAAPDPGEEAAARAWRLMYGLMMERKQDIPRIAATFGVNPGAMHALMHLDPDTPQSMSALADILKCDASNVTWLIDRLEENGLAERRPHPTDRRIRTVAITPKGMQVRAAVEAQLFEPPESLRHLSVRDLEALGKVLEKITNEATSIV